MSRKKINMLLVEDNEVFSEMLGLMLLSLSTLDISLQVTRSLAHTMKSIQDSEFDIIVLDYFLPDSRAPQSIRSIRDQSPQTPIIVLTGLDDYKAAIHSIKAGADDYLVKGKFNIDQLGHTIHHSIERHQQRHSLEDQNNTLKNLILLEQDDDGLDLNSHIW